MSRTEIDTMLWHIQREAIQRRGCSQAERDLAPLHWYIYTGRASCEFLRKLQAVRPYLIARDLAKGGSDDEIIRRIFKRIGYELSC